MKRTGVSNLPLHSGHAPRWLFNKMIKLSRAIATLIVDEHGTKAFLERLSDPFFFQSFSCAIGFDWHSSGCTTVACGALKAALNDQELGLQVCGGKGAASRKTPKEIMNTSLNISSKKLEQLIYSSRMSAKVDNSLIQDGYQLYHHCFVFDRKGNWAVIQQGMNDRTRYARRYHWISNFKSFVEEPHVGICSDKVHPAVLNLTAKESREVQKISLDIVNDRLFMRRSHQLTLRDLPRYSIKVLKRAYEVKPSNYEELVALRGMGPKTIRALALISELVYGTKPSWKDPARYSFAHGGKDGWPYPIDKNHYDKTISILHQAIEDAKIGQKEKLYALRRLREIIVS